MTYAKERMLVTYQNGLNLGRTSIKDDPLRAQMESPLDKEVDADIDRLSSSGADILAHRVALWMFAKHDDVGPTNNHAERELHPFKYLSGVGLRLTYCHNATLGL